MKKAKLAVIGTGGLAQKQHIPNICKSRNAELAVLCDLREDVLKELGSYYGIERLETDYKKVLADPEIDGVVIVTQADSHVPLTIEALRAGKHVYVEKPLAETEEPCRELVQIQEEANKIVLVGMNRRMSPAYRAAKDILWRNGGPKNIYYRIADCYSLSPGWGRDLQGGLRIVHEVCHIFDILRFFTESEVKSVYTMKARDDDEQIAIQFESGAMATIISSGYVHFDMPKEHFEAIADFGAVRVEDFVELKTFSMPGEPAKQFFKGHYHPQRDRAPAYLYEQLGAEALYALRRVYWEKELESKVVEKPDPQDSLENKLYPLRRAYWEKKSESMALGEPETQNALGAELAQEYLDKHAPHINYNMNKGWQEAIEHFADCILTGCDVEAATAYDGLQAAKITEAAIQSRETGQIVYLNNC